MRVIIDTNIFVSGIFFGGIPRKVLNLIQKRAITPCFIPATFSELETLLWHQKFLKQRNLLSFSINEFLEKLQVYSLFFPQPSKIPRIIKEDSADNHFLACALLSQAYFIISGDKHLLKLKEFQDIPILTPRQFLNQLKKII